MTPESHVEHEPYRAPEKRAFRVLLLLAVISSVLAVTVIALESSGTFKAAEPRGSAVVETPKKIIEPPVAPVTLLPESILQYATRGRQAIPGSEFPAAEAIYEVLDANIALASPVNSYAKATYFPSESEAQAYIDSAFKERYPKNNENLVIISTVIKTGYDASEGSYFVGWTRGSYSITIKTSFLDHIPNDKRDTLQKHALPIAKAILQEAKAQE